MKWDCVQNPVKLHLFRSFEKFNDYNIWHVAGRMKTNMIGYKECKD